MNCSIENCEGVVLARGWCSRHYSRWHRNGDPLGGRWKLTDEERYWPKVEQLSDHECWPWLAYRNRDGYGQFHGGGQVLAHRFVYELLVGPIPEGLTIDHLCRNRACQNPAHMEPTSMGTNTLRGISSPAVNARKTHCKRGHEFTPENTYLVGSRRACKACNAIRQSEYKKRRTKEYPKGLL